MVVDKALFLIEGHPLAVVATATAAGTAAATTTGPTTATATPTTVVVAAGSATSRGTSGAAGRGSADSDRSAFDAVEVRLVLLVELLALPLFLEVVAAFNEDGALI